MSDEPTVSSSYALGRLARAVAAATSHADPEVRRRAAARASQWQAVLSGMSDGSLEIGSRTPVADTPVWVTLEVAHGGFATGRYVAEGPLAEFEEELLALLAKDVPGETPRGRLNGWYVGDEGLRGLVAAVREGRVTVAVPEDGALPVVAWLLEVGRVTEALDLVATLRPLMQRLRFYPRLEATPRPTGAVVRVATIGDVTAGLRGAKPRPQIAAMNEALRVWNPLFDRLVALWLETVEGEVPRFVGVADARTVHGGWPGRVWPDGWMGRRDAWLADYRRAAAEHSCGRKHAHPDSLFYRLREVLERCAQAARLSVGDAHRVRHALAGTVTRRGAPGSDEHALLRMAQAEDAARPSNVELAEVLARRLDAYPANGGLAALEPVERAIGEGECPGVPAGTRIPEHMLAKAWRALEAPIAELVERGVIGSAEVLAIVLPQITSQVAAAGISDPGLRDLYGQIYAAFRRRRSLLLLNLESQVRFDELPWISALAPLRREGSDTQVQARQTLEDVAMLAFSGFPETILPNPLVREMRALAARAGVQVPFVEEVAADIFMGTFTEKWGDAAAVASTMLAGTLYGRYYDLPGRDHPAVQRGAGVKGKFGKPTADAFAALCGERAREAGTTGTSWVAKNGAILEQSQILTTHNLAGLVAGLGLAGRVQGLAPSLARRALKFAVRRQAQCPPDFKARLQAVKNAAYAWRQAIFWLSLCVAEVQWRALDELTAEVAAAADRGWAERFAPAVAGLRLVLGGGRFDEEGGGPGAVRFLGWAVGKHWALG
jgi:hypothetical protein